ncbi:MAG: ZIP family metal transporter [Candidatus Pacebacteria bacterium]|nr:ZIP family metal transporter [Candidatus Paceibacterota bacterium]MCF7862689.1 ZIP family metal transporter [Candidatus Paceibacterota bacterium]
MELNNLYPFLAVGIVSLISLVGVFTISLKEETIKKYLFLFISLATGALLGDAFIHLIPESFEESSNALLTSLLIILGIIIFFILEKILHWHHHGEDTEDAHIHPVGKLTLFSDGIHNLIDGIIIGASFLISIPVGIATTIAVIIHEIPQEIGDFAVLIHAGYKKTKALWLNFISALTSFLGVFIALLIGEKTESFVIWFLPIAAGGFIYIATADLIPEMHKTKEIRRSFVQLGVILFGVFLMALMTALETH